MTALMFVLLFNVYAEIARVPIPEGIFYDVKYVDCYDADTCTVVIPYLPPPFTQMKVRLRDVDAPEIKGKCPQEKELAEQAALATNGWMGNAKQIDLVRVKPDNFFRIDADIYVDGANLKDILLESHLVVPSKDKRTQDWCIPVEKIFPEEKEKE